MIWVGLFSFWKLNICNPNLYLVFLFRSAAENELASQWNHELQMTLIHRPSELSLGCWIAQLSKPCFALTRVDIEWRGWCLVAGGYPNELTPLSWWIFIKDVYITFEIFFGTPIRDALETPVAWPLMPGQGRGRLQVLLITFSHS